MGKKKIFKLSKDISLRGCKHTAAASFNPQDLFTKPRANGGGSDGGSYFDKGLSISMYRYKFIGCYYCYMDWGYGWTCVSMRDVLWIALLG